MGGVSSIASRRWRMNRAHQSGAEDRGGDRFGHVVQGAAGDGHVAQQGAAEDLDVDAAAIRDSGAGEPETQIVGIASDRRDTLRDAVMPADRAIVPVAAARLGVVDGRAGGGRPPRAGEVQSLGADDGPARWGTPGCRVRSRVEATVDQQVRLQRVGSEPD